MRCPFRYMGHFSYIQWMKGGMGVYYRVFVHLFPPSPSPVIDKEPQLFDTALVCPHELC